jgi:hypothetical protein
MKGLDRVIDMRNAIAELGYRSIAPQLERGNFYILANAPTTDASVHSHVEMWSLLR